LGRIKDPKPQAQSPEFDKVYVFELEPIIYHCTQYRQNPNVLSSFVVQENDYKLRSYTKKIFPCLPHSTATHPICPTRYGRKRTNAGNSTTNEDRRTIILCRLLAGRKSALVDDILGVLLFDIAGAVERRAGKSHETCVIEWLA
jgi:hypothetical protein